MPPSYPPPHMYPYANHSATSAPGEVGPLSNFGGPTMTPAFVPDPGNRGAQGWPLFADYFFTYLSLIGILAVILE